MTTANAIKMIEKKGYKAEHVSGERNKLFRVDLGKRVIEFYGGETDTPISCIGARRSDDQSDPMTDYCAFSFYENLTRALKFNV